MIKIRNFRPEDADWICDFKKETSKTDFPGCTFDRKLFKKLILHNSSKFPECVKIAEDDGKIVGCIWFKVIQSVMGTFGRIEYVYVDEQVRGKGLGKMLVDEAEDHFKKHGIDKIKLSVTVANDPALSFYRKLGYNVKRFKMEKDL